MKMLANSALINLIGSKNFYHYMGYALICMKMFCDFTDAMTCFTITAEIHAHSLVNFYCQYADRHMNLKFMRCVGA